MLMTHSFFVKSLIHKCTLRIVLHLGVGIGIVFDCQFDHIVPRRNLNMSFKILYRNLSKMDQQIVSIRYSHLECICCLSQDIYPFHMTSIVPNRMLRKNHTSSNLLLHKDHCLLYTLQHKIYKCLNPNISHNLCHILGILDCLMTNNIPDDIMYKLQNPHMSYNYQGIMRRFHLTKSIHYDIVKLRQSSMNLHLSSMANSYLYC